MLDLIEYINTKIFNLVPNEDYWYRLSLGDPNDAEKYALDGEVTVDDWSEAEGMLRGVLEGRNVYFEEAKGEAAFYGPKVDIQMRSITGKEDTAFTVQWDFLMPKRFNLEYVGADGKKHETVVIHRSSIGATERLIAFLTEKYRGAFPYWLAPLQVKVLPAKQETELAEEVYEKLLAAGIRVERDMSRGSLGSRIHEARKMKVPYLVVAGKRSWLGSKVTIESREGTKKTMSVRALVKKLQAENVPGGAA